MVDGGKHGDERSNRTGPRSVHTSRRRAEANARDWYAGCFFNVHWLT